VGCDFSQIFEIGHDFLFEAAKIGIIEEWIASIFIGNPLRTSAWLFPLRLLRLIKSI
jgi:hypothetical protein